MKSIHPNSIIVLLLVLLAVAVSIIFVVHTTNKENVKTANMLKSYKKTADSLTTALDVQIKSLDSLKTEETIRAIKFDHKIKLLNIQIVDLQNKIEQANIEYENQIEETNKYMEKELELLLQEQKELYYE
jgi:hypothetical protein